MEEVVVEGRGLLLAGRENFRSYLLGSSRRGEEGMLDLLASRATDTQSHTHLEPPASSASLAFSRAATEGCLQCLAASKAVPPL